MANFGESFSSGFSSGALVGQRNRQLGQQDRKLEQTQQQAQRDQLQGQLDVVNQTLDAFRSTVTEAAKNVGPERAKQFINDPRFQAQIAQAVEVRNAFMSQLGFSGGASANAEEVIAQMTRLADTQPSAQERGSQAGQEKVAEASAVASAFGGTPQAVADTMRTILGVNPDPVQAKTELGKLRQDLENGFIDSDQYAAGIAASQQELNVDNFKDSNSLRDEFVAQSGTFVDVRDAFDRIRAAASNPDGPGDLALIFSYMRLLDPTSTVRESEFAQAASAGDFGQRVSAAFAKVQSGELLDDDVREDFVNRANDLIKPQIALHEKRKGEYARLALSFGLKPEQILVDLESDASPIVAEGATGGTNSPTVPVPPRITTQAQHDALPSGSEYIAPDGTRRIKQ